MTREWNISRVRESINETIQLLIGNRILGKVVGKLRINKYILKNNYIDGKISSEISEISMSNNSMRVRVNMDLLKNEVSLIDIIF